MELVPPELSPELRILLGRGFAYETLRHFTLMAAGAGVTGDRFILAANAIDEPGYYRALAAELGLPFTMSGRVSGRSRFPQSIQAGVAPLRDPARGFLIAPRGAALIRLLQQPDLRRAGLVVTTPSALRRAVLVTKAAAIGHQSSNALAEWNAELSNRDGWLWRQMSGFCLIVFVMILSMALGRHTPLVAFAITASPLFFGMALTRITACVLSNPVEPPFEPRRIPNSALPTYTVIAALFREGKVVHKLVAALQQLDYPPEKLDVLIVLEADDGETQNALTALALPGNMSVVVAPPGYPRTKPRALNVALPLAQGEFTVVYDAEDVPDPGQLRLATAHFARLPPEVACLQARLTIDNTHDSWLTRMFTIEYAALFDVFNPGLAEISCPILLGGTSNHFRTRVLQGIGGWDAWNVTEDADLGIRLARLGYRVADLPSSTLEEAPSGLASWMGQRTRWMKGFIQTCIAHSRHPVRSFRQLGFWRSYGAMTVTLGTVLSALCYPFFTAFAAAILWTGQSTGVWQQAMWHFSATLFLLGLLAIYVPAFVALTRRRLWDLLPWTLLLPLYYLLVSWAAWRGVWELSQAPFRWNKTSHGLARTTRQSPPQKHHARAPKTISSKIAPP